MHTVCRLCRSWLLQRRIRALIPRLERILFAWSHDAVLARALAADAARVSGRDPERFQSGSALRIALYRAAFEGYRHYQRDHRAAPDVIPAGRLSVGRKPLVRQVRQAMCRLEERQRLLVGLIDLGGCSYAEAGQILAIGQSQLLADLCAARAQLKAGLCSMPALGGNGPLWSGR